MRRRSLTKSALLAGLLMVVTACGAALSGATPTTSSTEPETVDSVVGRVPVPLARWSLDRESNELELVGAYELSSAGLAFDGYSGHAITRNRGPLDTTESFTVSAWVNYANKSGIALAVGQLADVTSVFGLGVGIDQKWIFGMKKEDLTGPEHNVVAYGPVASRSNVWVHLTGVSDRAAGTIRLFVNGKLEAEVPYARPLNAGGPLTIGRGQFDAVAHNFWPGAVIDVSVFQTALSADQIKALYDTTRPASPPPPMPAPDPSLYANGRLNGTWDYTVPDGEFKAFVISNFGMSGADEVVLRLGFDNHVWWQGVLFDGELFLENGVIEGDGGTIRIEDDLLVTTQAEGTAEVTLRWTLEGDTLSMTAIEVCGLSPDPTDCSTDRSKMDPIMIQILENGFVKSGDDASY